MWEVHSSDKIRIKDIAERSGVSVGTVDRVLHNRPNVSGKARAKVEAVLKEINYQPNMYASYWTNVEKGLQQCILNRGDFHLSLITEYYDQFEGSSFAAAAERIWDKKPDGVVIVPQNFDVTQAFCRRLQEQDIPFVFLDSNVPEIEPLAFFGQDSLKSGYFAGRIFMMRRTRPTYFVDEAHVERTCGLPSARVP